MSRKLSIDFGLFLAFVLTLQSADLYLPNWQYWVAVSLYLASTANAKVP